MSCIAVRDPYVFVTKGLHIDCFHDSKHTYTNFPISTKPVDRDDSITDIVISADCKYLAAVSSVSKQLTVFDLPLSNKFKSFALPRSASKIRFTINNEQVLVADKTGDVLLYHIKNIDNNGTKLLGHLSLLLDILQTNDGKYIITSDRDEKIKVSCYPNTYNIQNYCLGHKEFVNHIEILPHDKNYLTSTSGDGTVKCWSFLDGKLLHTINTNIDVNDTNLKENFIKTMNDDGIEVNALPIVHYGICQLSESSSLLVVGLHTCNMLLMYKLLTNGKNLSHELLDTIAVNKTPAAIELYNLSLYIYDNEENSVNVFKIQNKGERVNIESDKKIEMFMDIADNNRKDDKESIKVLFKRKFDNVQEYQERKKLRLEKKSV